MDSKVYELTNGEIRKACQEAFTLKAMSHPLLTWGVKHRIGQWTKALFDKEVSIIETWNNIKESYGTDLTQEKVEAMTKEINEFLAMKDTVQMGALPDTCVRILVDLPVGDISVLDKLIEFPES